MLFERFLTLKIWKILLQTHASLVGLSARPCHLKFRPGNHRNPALEALEDDAFYYAQR